MKLPVLAVVVALGWAPQSQAIKPSVMPWFDVGPPAFIVSCANTSGAEIATDGRTQVRAWLDGRQIESSIPGLPPSLIYPGAVWSETFKLPENLVLGPHVIAFECGGARSDDTRFIWRIYSEG
jgi:hypothetical protein